MTRAQIAAVLVLFTVAPGSAAGGQEVPPAQTFVYKTVGDCRIKADVYRTGAAGARPALLWIHGGALIFGDREKINRRQLARYLEAGFVVVLDRLPARPRNQAPGHISRMCPTPTAGCARRGPRSPASIRAASPS